MYNIHTFAKTISIVIGVEKVPMNNDGVILLLGCGSELLEGLRSIQKIKDFIGS